MKYILPILFLFALIFVSCEEGNIPKPEPLIKEKEMIDILVDIHLAEATFDHFRHDTIMKNNSSANFYYSVLEKYNVPDSVFEQSLVYYASVPKNFDKMYQKIMSILSEKEQKYSGRKEKIKLEEDQKKFKIK